MKPNRLVVVSNRLPIAIKRKSSGSWTVHPGSGGLVTAMGPVLRDRGGLWVGWLGAVGDRLPKKSRLDDLLARGAHETGYTLHPVSLTQEEIDKYYYGFSNEVLWPLFHDFASRCRFDPDYWEAYERANRKFAEAILTHAQPQDYIWVQDYQLLLVARELKQLGSKHKTGFFLHIPFPPLDILLKLPWRLEILKALLEYDLVGFQTIRDRRNFTQCVRALIPETRIAGRGQVCTVKMPDRDVRAGAFPISIDFDGFAELAASKEVADKAWVIHENLPGRKLILGVDRLDYTKGIPQRLQGFADLLERYPELHGKVTLVQVLVPSRRQVEEYELLKQEIERQVGEINGKYTQVGWTPINYMFRSLDRVDLVAYYRTCEIALITPLKDGMNLVVKEYCACSIEGNGVVILSEFAGAAPQMASGALLVNPFDVSGVADAIHQALTMPEKERKARMRKLRAGIAKQNIFWWVNSYLNAAFARDLTDFPAMELFVPEG